MREAIGDFLSGWGLLIALALGVGLTALGFHVDQVGAVEGPVLALALPVIAILAPALAAMTHDRPRKLVVWGLFAAVAMAAELAVVLTMYPGDADARVDLANDRAADVELPAGKVEVLAHVDLASNRDEATYELELARGGQTEHVRGKLTREVRSGRRFRGGRASTLVVHETDAHEIELPGAGLAHVTAHDLPPDTPLHVEFRVPSAFTHHAALACFGLLFLAALYDGLERRRRRTHLATGTAVAGLFALLFVDRYNPDAVFSFVFGSAIAALVAGVLAGWLASWLVARVCVRAPAAAIAGEAGGSVPEVD